MMLDLSQDEARMLRELLQDYLPGLEREMSRTEQKDLRHALVMRSDLIERLVVRLSERAETAPER